MNRQDYRKQQVKKKRRKRLFFSGIALIVALIVCLVGLRIYAEIAGAPPITVPKSSIFLDRDGNHIDDYSSDERRYWKELKDISPFLIDATITVEDKDFYKHHGFDFSRIAGALLTDLKTQSKKEGGSTITQQLAKNLYLSSDKTVTRKLKEALYAYRLEIFYEKDDILEGYLNTVYYGHGMYGIEAASQYYFGKSAKDLTLAEAAMLAGIPKGPSIYSPINNYEKSKERQKLILSLMEAQDKITSDEKKRATAEHLSFKYDEWKSKSVAPYFFDVAWQEASDILKDRGRNINEGGFIIKTTLNNAHQKAAEEAVKDNMPNNDLQVGFVSMDVETGQVTALVGGRNYKESSFNRVTKGKRQPGSAIKPFLYAAALENGFNPLTFLDVKETTFKYDHGKATYKPKNVNGKFAENEMTLAQAIAISDNIYAVKTLENIGYKNFRDMLKRFDLNYSKDDNPSVALGTVENSLYNLTAAYTTIAAQGKKREATTIISIEDSKGNKLYEFKQPEDEKVISKTNAFLLTQLMTGMFDPVFSDYSPATGVSLRPRMTQTYAAKSGTTNSDQWMIGFSPSVVAGVWNGYDQGKTLSVQQDMAASKQVWIDFMESVNRGKNQEFKVPKDVEGVVVDIETGKLATDACPKQRLVYMKKEDVPKEKCSTGFFEDMWDDFVDLFPYEAFTDWFR